MRVSGIGRLAVLGATLALSATLIPHPAIAKESRDFPPRNLTTLVSGKAETLESCRRGAPGQTVILKYRVGKKWVELSRARLKRTPGGCAKGYPLLAQFKFTAPQIPRRYSFREDLLKRGKKPGATFDPYAVVVRQALPWTSEQQMCVDLIYQDSSELANFTSQGPERVPAGVLVNVNGCVERSKYLTQDYVNIWLTEYGLPNSDFPNAYQDLLSGRITADTFVDQVVATARVRYAGISSMITRQRSSLTVIYAYKRLVEDALEVFIADPMADPLLSTWLTRSLPVTLRDAERALRSDDRWQYTQRAFLEVGILVEELSCSFGFECDQAAIARMRSQLAALPAMVPRWPLF